MTKPLKVGIVGSHGVGKTTLARELSKILNVPLISEVARKYNVNTTDVREYFHIQQSIINDQLAAENNHNDTGFISDRTTIDNLAYFMVGADFSNQEFHDYAQRAVNNVFGYTHLIYVPIEFELEGDGFRSVDPAFQINIDMSIRAAFECYNIEYGTVTGSPIDRIDQALRFIRGEL